MRQDSLITLWEHCKLGTLASKKKKHTHTPAHLLAFCSARLLFLFHCFACAPVFCCAHKSLVREMKRTTGGPILMSSTSAKPVCAPVFWARSIYCTINSGCLIVSSRCFSSVVFWPQVNEFFFSASSPQEVLTSTLIVQANCLTMIPEGGKSTIGSWFFSRF